MSNPTPSLCCLKKVAEVAARAKIHFYKGFVARCVECGSQIELRDEIWRINGAPITVPTLEDIITPTTSTTSDSTPRIYKVVKKGLISCCLVFLAKKTKQENFNPPDGYLMHCEKCRAKIYLSGDTWRWKI